MAEFRPSVIDAFCPECGLQLGMTLTTIDVPRHITGENAVQIDVTAIISCCCGWQPGPRWS